MEQRSLRVLEGDKTFFAKINTALTKLLVPTKLSFNSIMISIKRNNLLKAYNLHILDKDAEDKLKKYEDSYALYLEAIDKYIIDSVYKKVKNDTATSFEREALSKYYTVVALKEKQYIEYKHKKQEYLIKIDFDTIQEQNKPSAMGKFNPFYVSRMDALYKGLLRNYSIQLSDKQAVKLEGLDNIYDKIFGCLEVYISDVLPIKISQGSEKQQELAPEYDKYERTIIGKLDKRDVIRKKMAMLGISRVLFTHSLPLVAASDCYEKLLHEAREFLVVDSNKIKKEKTFNLIVETIEEYNVKLLSTKVYWDNPSVREEYKEFWNSYKALEEKDTEGKKALFLKHDLREINKDPAKYAAVIKEYKVKLVEMGLMREVRGRIGSSRDNVLRYSGKRNLCRNSKTDTE